VTPQPPNRHQQVPKSGSAGRDYRGRERRGEAEPAPQRTGPAFLRNQQRHLMGRVPRPVGGGSQCRACRRLHTCDAQHTELGRRPDCVLEQRRLPRPRRPLHHDRAAVPTRDHAQKPHEPGTLVRETDNGVRQVEGWVTAIGVRPGAKTQLRARPTRRDGHAPDDRTTERTRRRRQHLLHTPATSRRRVPGGPQVRECRLRRDQGSGPHHGSLGDQLGRAPHRCDERPRPRASRGTSGHR
jgi:hypothetical protein